VVLLGEFRVDPLGRLRKPGQAVVELGDQLVVDGLNGAGPVKENGGGDIPG